MTKRSPNGIRKYTKSSAAALLLAAALFTGACTRYEPAALAPGYDPADLPQISTADESETETEAETETPSEAVPEEEPDTRVPVKVKGLYLASKLVNNDEFMDRLIGYMDTTELNAVVIDVKNDYGKITYAMQGVPVVDEVKAIEVDIEDLPGRIAKLKEHGVYCIARIVTFRDSWLAKRKPEWAFHKADGELFRDSSDYAWLDPYQTGYWEYLVEIAQQVKNAGFDEIQFDYVRFCTERAMNEVPLDEEVTLGRDRISIITEFVSYLEEKIRPMGLFVACDVFGTIIGSSVDARSTGQSYTAMAEAVDYMCPMVYPSHYADGNFRIEHPDLEPYKLIRAALRRSRNELLKVQEDGTHQAVVRPWLQAFTASWLGKGKYMTYDAAAVREQINGLYDAGYDEWILWSAQVKYDYSGFLSEAEAERERIRIEESRAALPPEETAPEEQTFPQELENALVNGELSREDEELLLKDGPIISYEQ